jgi:hypothetical protein
VKNEDENYRLAANELSYLCTSTLLLDGAGRKKEKRKQYMYTNSQCICMRKLTKRFGFDINIIRRLVQDRGENAFAESFRWGKREREREHGE